MRKIKIVISALTLSLVVLAEMGSATSSDMSIEVNAILSGRISVGRANGQACGVKVVQVQPGIYSPTYILDFNYVNKYQGKNKNEKPKLYSAKETFQLSRDGNTLSGRKMGQVLKDNQLPTTLQIIKDANANVFKAIYYNGSYIVCDQMNLNQ